MSPLGHTVCLSNLCSRGEMRAGPGGVPRAGLGSKERRLSLIQTSSRHRSKRWLLGGVALISR